MHELDHNLHTLPTPLWPNTRHSKTHLADCFLSKSAFFSLVTKITGIIHVHNISRQCCCKGDIPIEDGKTGCHNSTTMELTHKKFSADIISHHKIHKNRTEALQQSGEVLLAQFSNIFLYSCFLVHYDSQKHFTNFVL